MYDVSLHTRLPFGVLSHVLSSKQERIVTLQVRSWILSLNSCTSTLGKSHLYPFPLNIVFLDQSAAFKEKRHGCCSQGLVSCLQTWRLWRQCGCCNAVPLISSLQEEQRMASGFFSSPNWLWQGAVLPLALIGSPRAVTNSLNWQWRNLNCPSCFKCDRQKVPLITIFSRWTCEMNATYLWNIPFGIPGYKNGAVLAFWDTRDPIYKTNKYRKQAFFKNIKHYFDNTWTK